jgi:hypothetical protein
MRTTANLARSSRLALLLALAALILTAGATNAASGYNEPLRSAGERSDADFPFAQTAQTTIDLTAVRDTPRDHTAPITTTDLIPNPLPDPRVSPGASGTGVTPNPLPDRR